MLVAGLWHGAAWGFVIWGAIHGGLLILDKLQLRYFGEVSIFNSLIAKVVGWIVTMGSVFFAWIFFRNPNFHDSHLVVQKILSRSPGTLETSDLLLVPFMLVVTAATDLGEIWLQKTNRYRPYLYSFITGALLLIVLTYRSSEITPFIYFRF